MKNVSQILTVSNSVFVIGCLERRNGRIDNTFCYSDNLVVCPDTPVPVFLIRAGAVYDRNGDGYAWSRSIREDLHRCLRHREPFGFGAGLSESDGRQVETGGSPHSSDSGFGRVLVTPLCGGVGERDLEFLRNWTALL